MKMEYEDLKNKLIQDYENIEDKEQYAYVKAYIHKLFYDLYGLDIKEFTKKTEGE